MEILQIKGRIHPEFLKFTFGETVTECNPPENPIARMKIRVQIVESVVKIVCEAQDGASAQLSVILKYAQAPARARMESLAFQEGIGLTLLFDEFILPNGSSRPIFIRDTRLAGICTAYDVFSNTPSGLDNYNRVMSLMMFDPGLFMALSDLIAAITVHDQAITNCGRVVDGLRKVVTLGSDPKSGWPVFRETLNLDEAFVRYIMEPSKIHRHGDRSFISGQMTDEVVRRTWLIMNRVIEFKKRCGLQLPIADFPTLAG